MNQPNDKQIAETKFLRLMSRPVKKNLTGGRETVQSEDQTEEVSYWDFVQRKNSTGVVAVVARTASDEVILVEQFRPPLEASVIELPAGLVGDVEGELDESFESAARRELLEETGYSARIMTEVARGPTSAGLTDEIISLFLASDLTKQNAGGGDSSEEIIVHLVPLSNLDNWIDCAEKSGKLIDIKLWTGIHFLNKNI